MRSICDRSPFGGPLTTSLTFLVTLSLAFLLGADLGQPETETSSEDLVRISAMPMGYREHLLKNLETLESLPRDEQAQIRDLDRAIRESGASRTRLEAMLVDYHAWFSRLEPSDQRQILEQTDPQVRLQIVRQRVRSQSSQPKLRAILPESPLEEAGRRPNAIRRLSQVADQIKSSMGPLSPIQLARFLVVWANLEAERQTEMSGTADPRTLIERVRFLDRRGVALQLLTPYPADPEAIFRNMIASDPKERMPELLRGLGGLIQDDVPNERGASSPLAPLIGRVPQNNGKIPTERLFGWRFLQSRVRLVNDVVILVDIEADLNRRIAPVANEDLARFDQQLPDWYRDAIDHLTPAQLRLLLSWTYRLLYPEGQMPAEGLEGVLFPDPHPLLVGYSGISTSRSEELRPQREMRRRPSSRAGSNRPPRP